VGHAVGVAESHGAGLDRDQREARVIVPVDQVAGGITIDPPFTTNP
jgi:hypothetical protein